MLVTTPCNVTGLFWSNSASNEWCAQRVVDNETTKPITIKSVKRIGLLLRSTCSVVPVRTAQAAATADSKYAKRVSRIPESKICLFGAITNFMSPKPTIIVSAVRKQYNYPGPAFGGRAL